jgi:Flp pilus assembly secretin CpaC
MMFALLLTGWWINTVLAGNFPRSAPPETPNTVTMERVVLPQGANQTIRVDGLRRAAVGNPKVAKARAIPPDSLLLTAKSLGKTSLRTWSADGTERLFAVEVVGAHLANASEGTGVVRVALQFLELDSTAREDTGVRWPELVSGSVQGVVQGAAGAAGLSYTVGTGSTRGWIQQLVKEGRAKLLASPDLYVRVGEQATFSSGGEIPVPTTSENFGRVQKHVEWKQYGMTVTVKPESADTYHFYSDIRVELSELNQAQAIGGIPGLNRRKLMTKVNSLDGQTVLLSGLVRQLESVQDEGVPVLKDIPFLGALFSSRGLSRESHEILMAVTLSVPTRADFADRWEGFEDKFEKASAQ